MISDSWLKQISKNHHLYLISGDNMDIASELKNFLEKEWSFSVKANPDFFEGHYPTLYVEDSELIRAKANSRPIKDNKKVFILSFGFMTKESANSLLKIFEDPPRDVFFFIISPNSEKLPDTLKSRFNEIKLFDTIYKGQFEDEAMDFIKMTLGEKLSFSKKLSEDVSKERLTRAQTVAILKSIEKILKDKFSPNPKNILVWQEMEKCLSYLMDQSASIKIIFDQISLLTESLRVTK